MHRLISGDGHVPAYFQAATGNVIDDQAIQVQDVFDPTARHTISNSDSRHIELLATDLALIRRQILDFPRVPIINYRV